MAVSTEELALSPLGLERREGCARPVYVELFLKPRQVIKLHCHGVVGVPAPLARVGLLGPQPLADFCRLFGVIPLHVFGAALRRAVGPQACLACGR